MNEARHFLLVVSFRFLSFTPFTVTILGPVSMSPSLNLKFILVRALFIRDRIKVPTYIQSHDFAYIVRLNIDTKRVKQISMREPNGSINVDE